MCGGSQKIVDQAKAQGNALSITHNYDAMGVGVRWLWQGMIAEGKY